jgi:hypothetical protein
MKLSIDGVRNFHKYTTYQFNKFLLDFEDAGILYSLITSLEDPLGSVLLMESFKTTWRPSKKP